MFRKQNLLLIVLKGKAGAFLIIGKLIPKLL